MALRKPLPRLSPSKLLYGADKRNKCKYLIEPGPAVSVLPKACANRTSDATYLSLVATNNTTINTYGTSRRVVDGRRWSQTRLCLDIYSSGHQATNYRSRFSYTLQPTGVLKKPLSERHANRFYQLLFHPLNPYHWIESKPFITTTQN